MASMSGFYAVYNGPEGLRRIAKHIHSRTVAVAEALKNGEKVQLVGFGTFEVKERGARTGRNPKTGETIEVAASKHPAFSASKALKDQLN